MAFTCTARGTNAPAVSSYSTMTIQPSANIAAGKMAVLVASYDNSVTLGLDPYSSITDTDGNTWTPRVNQLNDPGAASGGTTLRIFTCQVATQIDTTDTITISVSTNVTAYALALWEVGSSGLAAYVTGNGATGTDSTPTVTTGAITIGDLVIGGLSVENNATPTGDADSTNGTWQTAQGANTGGTSTTGEAVSSQYKVVTTTSGATQTYNPTIAGVTRDWAIGYIVLHETEPTIAPNTADSTAFGTGTPTLEATATDSRSTGSDTYAFHVGTPAIVIWPPGEATAVTACFSGGADNRAAGQAFTAPSNIDLRGATFELQRVGSPTGNGFAKLYASSGGGAATPTGSALATSDAVDVTTIQTGLDGHGVYSFTFSTPYSLVNATEYFIVFEFNAGDISNYIGVGRSGDYSNRRNQQTTGAATMVNGSWLPLATADFGFGVYTTASPVSYYRKSDVDSGFVNTASGGDTDPFNSGEKVAFTVQVADTLAAGTYEWRARCASSVATVEDPWSAYTTARTFTVTLASGKDRHIVARGTRRGTARGIG